MRLFEQGNASIVAQGQPRPFGLPVLVDAGLQAFDKSQTTISGVSGEPSLNSVNPNMVLVATALGALVGGYVSYKNSPHPVTLFMGASFGATLGGVLSTLSLMGFKKSPGVRRRISPRLSPTAAVTAMPTP